MIIVLLKFRRDITTISQPLYHTTITPKSKEDFMNSQKFDGVKERRRFLKKAPPLLSSAASPRPIHLTSAKTFPQRNNFGYPMRESFWGCRGTFFKKSPCRGKAPRPEEKTIGQTDCGEAMPHRKILSINFSTASSAVPASIAQPAARWCPPPPNCAAISATFGPVERSDTRQSS